MCVVRWLGLKCKKPRTMARFECGVVAGLEPAFRISISIMPSLPDSPVDALLYPSNPQTGIELHHTDKNTALFNSYQAN